MGSLSVPANRHDMERLVMYSLFLVSLGMAKNLFSDVSVCTTEQCEVAALRLNENMNISIDSSGLKSPADPCDDFEKYACGKFQQNAQIPEDKRSYSVFTSELPDTIYKRGRKLLEADDKDDDWELFRMAKKLYKGCMNIKHREKLGIKPIINSLKHLGGWPLLEGENWNYQYQWWEQVYRASQGGFGSDYIIKITVETDKKNSSKRSIIVDQPQLGLNRAFLVKGQEEPFVQHYFS